MNEKINMAAKKMDLVVEELGKEYKYKNFLGEEIPYDEYYNEGNKKEIPIDRVLSDQNKIINILIDFYLENDLDDFITLFAIYCNNYIRYNFHRRIEDENFKLERLWDVIKNRELQDYLLLIQSGISNRNINFFRKAIEIFKEYSLPYLYLFLDTVELIFKYGDRKKENDMMKYYFLMNEELREYALADSEYNKKILINPAIDLNYLPHAKFVDSPFSYLKNRNITVKNDIDESYKNNLMVQRLFYLRIPWMIETNVEDRCKELLKNKFELKKSEEQLEKVINSKNALIDRHAHNWKHIVYPETVKEIAEALYNEGNIEYANKLFKAYNSENILQNDLQLLRLNYASSEEEMQEMFRHDILLSSSKTGLNILDIIENSLDVVMFRIIMEGVDCSYISQEVKSSLGAFNDIEMLRKSYTKNFIEQSKKNISIIEWFNDNIYSLNIKIDKLWKDVKIKKNNIAYTQLIEIFINLIHNAINYGIKSKDGFINLKLELEEIDDILYYTLNLENPIDYKSYFYEGSKQGIKSIKNTLEKLNRIDIEKSNDIKSISIIGNENLYTIKLYFSENLIVKRRS